MVAVAVTGSQEVVSIAEHVGKMIESQEVDDFFRIERPAVVQVDVVIELAKPFSLLRPSKGTENGIK